MASFEKHENGTWSVRFRFQEFGITKNKRLSGFKLKREAEAAYQDFVRNYTPTEAPKVTKFKEVSKLFLDYVKDKNKLSSYVTIEPMVRLHYNPYFGEIIFTEITDADIRLWKTKISHYSYEYKDHLWAFLKSIFHFAENHLGILNYSYKKVPPFKREIIQTWDFWTEEEFSKFIKVVDDPILHAAFSTFYLMGFRSGELRALTWSDIDVKNSTISISKTITNKTGGNGYAITTPKTMNSKRTVIMPRILVNELTCLQKNSFVFGINEKPLSAETLRRKFSEYIKASGVKQIKIHELRHSHVSLLINKGESDLSVAYSIAERIGDSVEMVLKTYGHLFRQNSEKLVKKLEDIKL